MDEKEAAHYLRALLLQAAREKVLAESDDEEDKQLLREAKEQGKLLLEKIKAKLNSEP